MTLGDPAATFPPVQEAGGLFTRRCDVIERLVSKPVDVLVVGAGITGAGVARDAAMRGLRVALVDQGDFACGTSSRSSRLVHGGLRYLENFEFGLVFEALRERAIQRRLQPHLVWPQRFVLPIYDDHPNGLLRVSLGMWIYDLLSVFRSYRLHRRFGIQKTLDVLPGLRPEGLRGSVVYYDCRTDDTRLTLANILDAERRGARVANHVRFERPVFAGDQVAAAQLTDGLSGRALTVECRHIVYAAGPWTDRLPETPGSGELMRPSKGVHLAVPQGRLPLDAAVVMIAPQDGRVVFAIPDGGSTVVGTTDTDHDGDHDQVRADSADVAYLLAVTNAAFPGAALEARDVTSTWAGVRPLIRSEASSGYKTSREHQRFDDPRGITIIAGGKLTTYRSMAEEVVDAAAKALKRRGLRKVRRCRTSRVPLDVGVTRRDERQAAHSDPTWLHLWRHHGSGMQWIQDRLSSHPEEGSRLHPTLPYVMAEVSRCVLVEHAQRVDDALERRLHVRRRAPDQGLGCVHAVARHMASLLGHDDPWVEQEVAAYRALVERSLVGARALEAPGAAKAVGA